MAQENRPKIIFVYNHPYLFRKIDKLLKKSGFQLSCSTNPDNCLLLLGIQSCDLLIVDYEMPKMDVIEFLKKVKRQFPWQPVLIINGRKDIPIAVKVIKEGSVDYFYKPLNIKVFVRTVRDIIKNNREVILLYHSLTKMEKDVLKLVLLGKNCQESVILLGCKYSTIQVHYKHLRKKFGVHNVMNIIGKVYRSGLVKFPKEPDL